MKEIEHTCRTCTYRDHIDNSFWCLLNTQSHIDNLDQQCNETDILGEKAWTENKNI